MSNDPDQLELIPPYCPNSLCKYHFGTNERFYVKNGFTRTQKKPFLNQRYKCKNCFEQFSSNTFSVDFRKRQAGLSEEVLYFSMNGLSNNSLAKRFKVSEGTVRNRLKTLSKQALLFEIQNAPKKFQKMLLTTALKPSPIHNILPATSTPPWVVTRCLFITTHFLP